VCWPLSAGAVPEARWPPAPARGRRESYYAFCSLVARVLVRRVGARLHWGKHFPLEHADITPLYPRKLCRRYDRAGMFRNVFTFRVLGLGR